MLNKSRLPATANGRLTYNFQLRWRASFGVRGGFDSVALPPVKLSCFNTGIPGSPAGFFCINIAI